MEMRFAEPWWLIVAAGMVILAGWVVRRPGGKWAVALPLVGAGMVALALAGMSLAENSRNVPVVILLDMSASTVASPWRNPEWVRKLAAERLGEERVVTVVGFDREPWVLLRGVRTGAADAWPVQWTGIGNVAQTDMEKALAWRDAAEGKNVWPRWVISDGLAGIDVDERHFEVGATMVPPASLDFAVADVQVRPTDGGVGMEVLGELRVRGPASTGDILGTVRLARDGAVIGEHGVQFSAAAGGRVDEVQWVSFWDELSGQAMNVRHRYEMTIVPDKADAWPRNDRGAVMWIPPGRRQVLLVTERPGAQAWWQQAGVEATEVVRPADFAFTAAGLSEAGVQEIILDDVPAASPKVPGLSSPAIAAMDEFVKQTGAGLLIVGRGHAFGPGGYDGTGLAELSPFYNHPHTGGRQHFVMILDASASMNESAGGTEGETKFQLLVHELAPLTKQFLATDDRLSVITFNSSAETFFDGPAAKALDADDGLNRLARLTPGGATNPDAALGPLATAISGDAADEQLVVIFVTDGDIPPVDKAKWKGAVAAKPGGSVPRFVLIAPDSAHEKGGLTILSDAVGAQWYAGEAQSWPSCLSEALRAQVMGKVQNEALAWQTVDTPQIGGRAIQWTQVWMKPEATLVAAGGAHPLAAIVQRGLGKVAAVAISESDGFDGLVKQMGDRVSAGAGDRRVSLSAHRDADQSGGWVVAADAAGGEGFMDGQTLEAAMIPGNGPGQRFVFTQTGPGHYEAHVTSNGAMAVSVVRASGEWVGQVRLPEVETGEWPASVQRMWDFNAVTAVSGNLEDDSVWRVAGLRPHELSGWFWAAAAVAGLWPMFRRR